ncbi:tetratricopeptide repeat protein [candidate division TA06 bacterium]|uniref:Tetratricopeptide repeat protein n=1 Tax=candidate division TA06 bacterium TaxID=2250710 RepID=A0A933I7G1_UNCT6|nr:tetratricopeptide repeat protein [candidate division TA06 bacterium]
MRQAEAISWQGLVSLAKGEFEKAEERYNRALGKYLAHKNLTGQVECYNGLGKLMQYLEKNEKAYEYYALGLKICKKNGDKKNECKCLINIVDCYYAIGKKTTEAIKILEELVVYYESLSDIKNIGHTYSRLGSLCIDIEDYQKALKYLKTSEDIADKIGDCATLLNIYCYAGFACFKTRQYEYAKTLFFKCYDLSLKQGLKYMQAVSLLNIGDVYNEMNEISQAREYLDKMRSMNIGIPGLNEEAQRITNELIQKEKEVN